MPLILHNEPQGGQQATQPGQPQTQPQVPEPTANITPTYTDYKESPGSDLARFAGKVGIEAGSRITAIPANILNAPTSLINLASQVLPGIPKEIRDIVQKNVPADLATQKLKEKTGIHFPTTEEARETFGKAAGLEREPGSIEDLGINFLGDMADFMTFGGVNPKQAAKLTAAAQTVSNVGEKAGKFIGGLFGEESAERGGMLGSILGYITGAGILEAGQKGLARVKAAKHVEKIMGPLEKEIWAKTDEAIKGKTFGVAPLETELGAAQKEISRLNPGTAKSAAEGSIDSVKDIIEEQKIYKEKGKKGKEIARGKEGVAKERAAREAPALLVDAQGNPIKSAPTGEIKQGNILIEHIEDKIKENNQRIHATDTPPDVKKALQIVNEKLQNYMGQFMDANPDISNNYYLGKELSRAKYAVKDVEEFISKQSGMAKFINNPMAKALIFSGVPGGIFAGLVSKKFLPTLAATGAAGAGIYGANLYSKFNAAVQASPHLAEIYKTVVAAAANKDVSKFRKAAVSLNRQLNKLEKLGKAAKGLTLHS